MKNEIRKYIRKIIIENCNKNGDFNVLYNIKEGVGDKYLMRKYPNFPDEEEKFERMFRDKERNKDNVFYSKEDWKLIKNPGSLKNFGSKVRGVIISNGDLYIESYSAAIHHDILKILFNKGVLKGTFSKNWNRKTPDENGFITVQRKDNTNLIGIGESNKIIYNELGWDEFKDEYGKYMNKASLKNTKITFINKLVGFKFNKLKSMSNTNRITETKKMRNLIQL